MRMGGGTPRVCTECPAYAGDLERSHPLTAWRCDLVDVGVAWVDAVKEVQGCCDGQMGEDSESKYNEEYVQEVRLQVEREGGEEKCGRRSRKGKTSGVSGGAARTPETVRHEAAMAKCAAHGYGASIPRPARVRTLPSGSLDKLPDRRLDVSCLREGLRADEAEVLRLALTSPLLRDSSRFHASQSRLSGDDLAVLLRAGVVVACEERPHITLPVFTIPKRDGSKRLLVDGRRFDERTTALPSPLLPRLADFEEFVRKFSFFSVLDFLGYFLQIPVHGDVQDCLGIRVATESGKSRYFRFTVAVPGIARAPLAAQLCTLAVRRLAGVSLASVATYDDVGIGGTTRGEVLARERALRDAAARANMSIRADKGFSCASVGELCGMVLDLAAKEISLPRAWVAKVAVENPTPRTLSCRAASHHIGCLWWAHYVMREPLAARPLIMRLGRALGKVCKSAAHWDAVLILPEGCWTEMRAAEQWLRVCPPRRLVVATVEWHLWTDASDQGGSVVLLDPRREVVLVRERWTWEAAFPALVCTLAPIRRRELFAAMLGCLMVAAVAPRGCRVRVFHDNTTAESRHRKLSSPHPQECALLTRAHRALVLAGVADVRTTLVPTAKMVADLDTRA
eukprot:Rhum_TRINITY_DN14909_c5_g2::Rhum_TRINITY_DN14909_c5_g2_i1::g.127517::m.127517